ncbi:MAG: dephospho-CoA kinase [Coriobacteriales bacterium]
MHKVVLGGTLASGKSTVAKIMKELGADVSNLDDIAVEVRNTPEVSAKLAERFGSDILDSEGHPIPKLLAERAFADAQSTADLNSICHPGIGKRAREFILGEDLDSKSDSPAVRVLEVPLLDKAEDLVDLADETVCVVAPVETRIHRAQDRGMDIEDAKRRISVQADESTIVSMADTVIVNDSTIDELRRKVGEWWNGISNSED